MKKEPLSIMIVKTLLAVIIFTGMGTIIIGGGWLIGRHYENKTSDKTTELVDQEIIDCVKKGEIPSGKECCEGLVSRTNSSQDKTGKCVYFKSRTSCMACGDGICEGPPMNENKCNCPEDCAEKDETADWKTYQNEEYGFEVKYPENLIPYENNLDRVIYDKRLLHFNKDSKRFIEVDRFELKKSQIFKDIITNNSWLPGGGPRHPEFSDFEERKIGVNSFYFRSVCFDTGMSDKGENLCESQFFYWLVGESEIYEFNLLTNEILNSEGVWYSEDPELVEKILSTFKFIEKKEGFTIERYDGLNMSEGLYRANSTNSPLNITYKCDGPLRNLENIKYEYCETNEKDYLTQYEFSDLTTSGFGTGGGTVWRWYKLYIKKINGVDFVFQGYLDDNLNWSNADNWIDGPSFYSKEDKEKYKRLSTKKYLDGILTNESVIDKVNKWDEFVENL